MKKTLSALILAIAGAGSASAFIDSYSIKRESLPEEAQEMLSKYFPKAKVGMIKIDRHLLKKTDYDVKLVNGTKIEFSNAGKWKLVDCQNKEVPESLVPSTIRKYVKKNFSDVKITMIEKKTLNYLIGLSDGVVLKFDLLGTFNGVDSME